MITDVVDRQWAQAGDRLAIRDAAGDVTFSHLSAWSKTISAALEPLVREPGQRVALMLPNSARFAAAFFAVARLGGVVAPLNPQYRAQELRYYLGDLEPAALVTDAAGVEAVWDVESPADARPAIVELVARDGVRVARSPHGRPAPLASAGSPPLLQQYTSGSTGTPKRVVRTHATLLAEMEALREAFGVDAGDRFLGAAPFSHVNGLVRTMMTSMYVGATLYPVAEFRRREVLDLLTREQITLFGGVPQMFALLAQTPTRGDANLCALRLAFSSSAPLLSADVDRFSAKYGVVLRQLYGSTETGTISLNRHPEPATCPQSVGAPLRGVRVDVVDEHGGALAAGHEGELVIASPFAASGYLGNPAATADSFRGGFYFSGDLGTKDAAGSVTITGRKKLLINRGGFKVNPYEVEAAIREHPDVADVAVYGAPSPHGDDVVCCAIVAATSCTAEAIVRHCRERIADYKVPTRIEFRDALPKSTAGKVLRSQLVTAS
ncbi:MAG: acyl--CoA ligase [Candidatus Rokubacteria bacterium]|nr:acyl--CoA ligase [Candidatus Rokubacteria bacterium]